VRHSTHREAFLHLARNIGVNLREHVIGRTIVCDLAKPDDAAQ
jgi:hypothetical protein